MCLRVENADCQNRSAAHWKKPLEAKNASSEWDATRCLVCSETCRPTIGTLRTECLRMSQALYRPVQPATTLTLQHSIANNVKNIFVMMMLASIVAAKPLACITSHHFLCVHFPICKASNLDSRLQPSRQLQKPTPIFYRKTIIFQSLKRSASFITNHLNISTQPRIRSHVSNVANSLIFSTTTSPVSTLKSPRIAMLRFCPI